MVRKFEKRNGVVFDNRGTRAAYEGRDFDMNEKRAGKSARNALRLAREADARLAKKREDRANAGNK